VSRRTARLLAAALAVLAVAGCGKRGNPLPPLRPVPTRILDLAATRIDDRIELTFTVPATNLDGSTPVAIDRVDIYALSGPTLPTLPPPVVTPAPGAAAAGAAGAPATPPVTPPATPPAGPPAAPPATPAAPPPADPAAAAAAAKMTPAQRAAAIAATLPPTGAVVADPKNLIGRVVVRPPEPEPGAAPAAGAATPPGAAPAGAAAPAPDARPGRGERATFVDKIDLAALTGKDMGVRYYVAIGVSGDGRGRSGPISGLVAVPLVALPATPQSLAAAFDETTVKVTWLAEPTVPAVNLYEIDSASPAAPPRLLTPKPIAGPAFETPVEFGRERCFVARTAGVIGPATLLSAVSAPACVTPVDRFAPPAVSGLQAVQEGAAVTLVWTAVDVKDLAGYVVLRVESPGDTLQPLTKTVVTSPTYRDESVRAGATFVYAIVAVDTAGNQGPPSERQTVTVR
jgi:hypothetical protein